MIRSPLVIISLGLALTACAPQLQEINRSLANTNAALADANRSLRAGPAQLPTKGPSPSEAQVRAIQAQITAKQNDALLRAAIDEARPNIQTVITFLSCYPGWDAGRYLGQYLTPEANQQDVLAPMPMMKYHQKAHCLTVNRMDGWGMPARNALVFRVLYLSDASGESRAFRYELVKQADGAWLFRRASF